MRIYAVLPLLMAIVAVTVSAGDIPRSSFDRVSSGELVVYPIDDLTNGQQQLADRVAGLIQDTVDSDAWKGEWRGAAMRSTPGCLTVKAPGSVQDSVAQLLHQLREQRNLFIQLDYQLLSAGGEIKQSGVLRNAMQNPALKGGGRIVGTSQAMIWNGDETTLVDGTDLTLPTITAQATVSADRTAVTLTVCAKDPFTLKNTGKPAVFSSPSGESVGVPIPTASGTDWLVLQPQLVERHWTPIGTARMINLD